MDWRTEPVRPPLAGVAAAAPAAGEGRLKRAPLTPGMMRPRVCHCGAIKDAGHVFCDRCWKRLPLWIRAMMATDFDRAFRLAVEALGWE
jgi:hypothetical protein